MDLPRRLTVMQILPALEGGGVERGVLEVAEAIVAAGHRSLVVSSGGRMVQQLTNGGSHHFAMPIGSKSPAAIACVPRLRQLLVRQRVDVVDYHSRLPGWVTLAAWRSIAAARRPKLISTLHGLHSVGLYSSIMCRGQWVAVVSETVMRYVHQHYPATPHDSIRLIHRGIDAAEFPPGLRPTEQWKRDFYRQFPELVGKRLITLAGRITRLKGHDDLLQSIARLRREGIVAHGLIVGGTDPKKQAYRDWLTQRVKHLGMEDAITFTGARHDLPQLYAISDAVVSLSNTPESFGRTVCEALSIGVPVVGYDHGGVSEILAAQFPLGAVPRGDVDALVSRLRYVLENDVRNQIGLNPFPRERMLARTLDLYAEAMASSPMWDERTRRAA
jgi:glycosyltransferase involved in cell wall biosynthesis